MLILTRKTGEKILFETSHGTVTVQVTKVRSNRAIIGIHAPRDVKVIRGELEKES